MMTDLYQDFVNSCAAALRVECQNIWEADELEILGADANAVNLLDIARVAILAAIKYSNDTTLVDLYHDVTKVADKHQRGQS